MKDIADDLALIVRNAIDYINKLEQQINELKRKPVQGCPSCEYNKQRAQLWRNEAYKLGRHPLDWEPELMVRPKPLTDEEIRQIALDTPIGGTNFARAIERAHGIGQPPCATGDCIPSKCNICEVKE